MTMQIPQTRTRRPDLPAAWSAYLRNRKAPPALDAAIERPRRRCWREQRDDGHWVFELEADATIPAEYVLLQHYLGERRAGAAKRSIAAISGDARAQHGGWPLFTAEHST